MDKLISDFNVRLRTITIIDLILGIIFAMIISGILMVIFPVIYDNDDLFMIVYLTILLLFFVFCLRKTTGLENNIQEVFTRKNRNEILYVFAINLMFAFLFTFLIGMLDLLIGMTDPNWVTGFDIDSVDLTPSAFIFSSVASIVFAPVLEELIFRGVLFNRLKIRIGILPAMILSSFLFAIGHDFGGITSAFLFGVCMCIIYLKTDNIIITMSVHCLNNIVATVLELINIDLIVMQIPWLFILGIITLVATVLLLKYIIDETSKIKKSYN